jgi:C4-dicarboxylate-specific signal transduction histidine kinase
MRDHHSTARLWAVWGSLLVLWLLASWLMAEHSLQSRTEALIQRETVMVEVQADNTVKNISHNLAYLYSIPYLIARDARTAEAVKRSEITAAFQSPSIENLVR